MMTLSAAQTALSRFLFLLPVALMASGCSQPLGLSSGSGSPYGSGMGTGGAGNGANPPVPPAPRSEAGHNPDILGGLEVLAVGKWGVRVQPGSCVIGGKTVTVGTAATLSETPCDPLQIRGEKIVLADDPAHSYNHGTALKALISDITPLPGALDPHSLIVWSAAGDPRQAYRINRDYLLDPEWGTLSRKPGGAIPAGAPVYVDYTVRQMRLDTVEVRPDGAVTLKKGTPARMAPEPAAPDAGSLALASVFLDYGTNRITGDSVYPIGAAFPAPTEADRQAMAAAVVKTRQKLQAGGHATIVFWGDSVTEGGTASVPAHRFPDMVVAGLEKEFKGAQVTLVNAGVGGSTIESRLPGLDRDVLSHHPDLVVVEFVNDMALPAAVIRKDYTAAVQKMKAAGAEVILTTPHFTMPAWMGMRSLRGKDPRPGVGVVREVARAEHVGLADVSRRWEHLASEGTPYVALLYNGINHPDDRGHAIYAHAIESFF